MVVSDLLGGACQAGLCAVALLGGSAAWAIALAVLTMASTCAYDPAVTATVPGVVTESDLPAANALVQTVENLVLIAGPALGAVLLAVLSPSAVFAVNAGSFLGGALLVSRIGVRSTPVDVTEGGTAGLRAQLAVGVRAITGSRRAATLVAGVALTSFLYGTDTVQLVGVATERLGTGARGFGWLLAAMGVGGVLIAPAVEQVSRLNRLVPVITGGIVAMGLPTLLLLAVRQPVAAAALEACRGAGMLVVDTLAMIALQRSVPADRLARVCGVLWAIAIGAITLGAAIASPVIDAVGLAGSLWLFGTAPIALVVLALPALRGLDREAAAHVAELEPRIAALAGTSVFAVADRALLERLAEGAREIEVPQGEAIITEGEPADALYVLLSGAAEVRVAADHETRPRAILGAGAIFGEIGLIEQRPRGATVTARSSLRALRVDGERFLEALSADPIGVLLRELARSRQTSAPAADLTPAA
jgi:hypothetical protein